MTQIFQIKLNTDADKARTFQVKGAKADLEQNEFDANLEKILISGIFDNDGVHMTGVKSGELVTTTRVKYA